MKPLAILLRWSALGAALAAVPAWADPAPSFPELLARAESTPTGAQAAAELAAAKARRSQAGVWANPEVDFTVEGAGAARGGRDPTETTAAVSQVFELGGKRAARVGVAQGELNAAQARFTLSHTDFAARLAVAYAEAEAAQRRQEVARDALEAAETDARAARLLFQEGREAELRSLQASAEADRARGDLAEADATASSAFAHLAALAGVDQIWDRIAVSLLDSAPESARPLSPAASAIDAVRGDVAAAAARVRSARAEAIPDVKLSAGVRHFAETDSNGIVAGVSVPLPLFNRNAGGISAAQAELRAAEAKARQTELDLAADFRAAAAAESSAQTQLDAAQSSERAAAEAYRLARIGYQSGKVALLELTAARRAYAEARGRTVQAKLARVRATAELARLSGRTAFGS